MKNENEVKNTDTNINPHWDGKITITKEIHSDQPAAAITIVETPETTSILGVTANTTTIGFAVLALFVVIIGYRYVSNLLKG
jgi:hypothetical protein